MPRCAAALAAVCVLALALVPAAPADGPPLGAVQGDPGVAAPSGTVRYVAVGDAQAGRTLVQEVRVADGTFVRWAGLAGSWGIPTVTYGQAGGGLSRDGRLLVLAPYGYGAAFPRTHTRFVLFDTRRFVPRATIRLRGDFAYDALSPSARLLFLIQRVSSVDVSRYVVRAYDLAAHRLLPRAIADRTQRGWVMQGYPVARVTGPGGRRVYTLYMNPANVPFVHALDTVSATAHCIGIPWAAGRDQGALFNLRLSLREGGRVLALRWRSGRAFVDVDTRTWRVSPPGGGSRPWLLPVALGAVAATLAALALGRRRRRLAVPSPAPV